MKYKVLSLTILFIGFNWHTGVCQIENKVEVEEVEVTSYGIYPGLNLVMANPLGDFWNNYSERMVWGVNLDLVFSPFKKAKFIKPGVQLEYLHLASRTDPWGDLDLNSYSNFFNYKLFTRLMILRNTDLNPYFELGYGRNRSRVASSYLIDEENTRINKYKDSGNIYCVGLGINLYRYVNLQFKYSYSPTMTFVDEDGIKISEGGVNYVPKRSKIQMLQITLGIGMDIKHLTNL